MNDLDSLGLTPEFTAYVDNYAKGAPFIDGGGATTSPLSTDELKLLTVGRFLSVGAVIVIGVAIWYFFFRK